MAESGRAQWRPPRPMADGEVPPEDARLPWLAVLAVLLGSVAAALLPAAVFGRSGGDWTWVSYPKYGGTMSVVTVAVLLTALPVVNLVVADRLVIG